MCGIAGIHIKRPGCVDGHKLERLVDQLLLGIEHRGRDATGIAATTVGGKRVLMAKEPIPASQFIRRRPSLGMGEGGNDVRTVILHTRFATQGEPEKNVNNHPVLRGTTFVTHNGHINNDSSLFYKHEITRLGEVDSEIIPALIEKYGMDKVHLALQELEGGFAVAVINPTEFPDQLILAKGNSSPLFMLENDKFILWASTVQTIKDAWGVAFGTPPSDNKFQSFSEGDILYIEGAATELLQFEVKETYTYTRYSGSGTSYYYGSALTDREKNERCTSCGHTRFWHSGQDYDGGCVCGETINGEKFICRCMAFIEAVLDEDEKNAWTQCDGCMDWMPVKSLTYTAENYCVCDDCYAEYEGDNPRLTLLPGGSEDEPALLTRGEHDNELAEKYADEIIKGDGRPMAVGEMLDWHNHILNIVSENLDYSPEFIEWILFRAKFDVIDGDTWLTEARSECDTAYADAEEELRQWEVEIGVDQTPKGVIATIAKRILH